MSFVPGTWDKDPMYLLYHRYKGLVLKTVLMMIIYLGVISILVVLNLLRITASTFFSGKNMHLPKESHSFKGFMDSLKSTHQF